MTDKVKPVLMPVIKGIDPNVLAADICSVQPMPSDAIANLYEDCSTSMGKNICS